MYAHSSTAFLLRGGDKSITLEWTRQGKTEQHRSTVAVPACGTPTSTCMNTYAPADIIRSIYAMCVNIQNSNVRKRDLCIIFSCISRSPRTRPSRKHIAYCVILRRLRDTRIHVRTRSQYASCCTGARTPLILYILASVHV